MCCDSRSCDSRSKIWHVWVFAWYMYTPTCLVYGVAVDTAAGTADTYMIDGSIVLVRIQLFNIYMNLTECGITIS
jgi:hypothetical protein